MAIKPPYLAAALICENVLLEQDGVSSVIRIIDRIFVPELASDKEPSGLVPLTLFLSFKSGGFVGKGTAKLIIVSPSGKAAKPQETPLEFKGDPNGGANMIVRAAIAFKEEGVYWFDVYYDSELVTRMPLDVQLMKTEMLQSLPGAAAPRKPE